MELWENNQPLGCNSIMYCLIWSKIFVYVCTCMYLYVCMCMYFEPEHIYSVKFRNSCSAICWKKEMSCFVWADISNLFSSSDFDHDGSENQNFLEKNVTVRTWRTLMSRHEWKFCSSLHVFTKIHMFDWASTLSKYLTIFDEPLTLTLTPIQSENRYTDSKSEDEGSSSYF